MAQAEVSRLAGALDEAEASLRRALQFYEDRRMVPLAERTRALLASLAGNTARTEAVNQRWPSSPGAGDPPRGGSPPPVPRPAPRGRLPAPGPLPGVQHDVPLDLGQVPLVGDP